MKTTRGYSLIECLVYIAVLAVVLNLSFLAYYRYNQHSNSLRRNAAALPKIRMPSTTMIAVDSWVPTPSWSPT